MALGKGYVLLLTESEYQVVVEGLIYRAVNCVVVGEQDANSR